MRTVCVFVIKIKVVVNKNTYFSLITNTFYFILFILVLFSVCKTYNVVVSSSFVHHSMKKRRPNALTFYFGPHIKNIFLLCVNT